MKRKFALIAVLISVLSMVLFSACESGTEGTDTKKVTILSIEQTGGTSGSVESSGLIISFDVEPTTLTADDITVSGATKGTLSESGTERTLVITNITVENEESVSVTIASPEGYIISGSPVTAVVYNLVVGMDYLGGKLAYVFKEGDQGYVSGETHGLIAAVEDLDDNYAWIEDKSLYEVAVPGDTSTAVGSGSSNTDKIIALAADAGMPVFAAILAREYDGGGYSDWYLPSKDELNILYTNKALIGAFSDKLYWSSSEESAETAWAQNFTDGMQNGEMKHVMYSIRPLRSF